MYAIILKANEHVTEKLIAAFDSKKEAEEHLLDTAVKMAIARKARTNPHELDKIRDVGTGKSVVDQQQTVLKNTELGSHLVDMRMLVKHICSTFEVRNLDGSS